MVSDHVRDARMKILRELLQHVPPSSMPQWESRIVAHLFHGRQANVTRGQSAKANSPVRIRAKAAPATLVAGPAIERKLRLLGPIAFPAVRFELTGLIVQNDLAAIGSSSTRSARVLTYNPPMEIIRSVSIPAP